MTAHIDVSTQEVDTGRWFTVISYYPASPMQRERADEMVDSLRTLGLNARKQEVSA
jgi:hypothetical protein